jgi:hypothetical protein
MGVMTMKELCEYSKVQRHLRGVEHRRKHKNEGLCGGLTDKEYRNVVHKQKSSFSKARKFTHNKMWQETSRKFEVKELKLISKWN